MEVQYIFSPKFIKENGNFDHFSNSNIQPAVLDGRNEIILANWPSKNILNAIKMNTLLLKYRVFHTSY